MSISNVSRAKGSSSCASLAYIAASKVYEERTHQTYSYGRKERVMKVATLLPDDAPTAYADATQLFNAIEKYEQASNARTAKKIVVALPRELSLDESDEILTDFIRDNLCANGYCATYAIHRDKDGNNPHAHILVANRQINKKGEWSSKRKMEYALDEKGERIPLIDKKTGKQKVDKRNRKQWKRISAEQNPLDKKQFLEQLREAWAVECNKHLSQEDRIDHRSNAARGIDDIPTIHEGYAARAMEARGDVSDRMEINRHIRLKNDLIHQLVETLKEIRDKVLNANIERLAKHDHENGWVSQIYATAKKWLTHNRTHEVVAPPTPPTTPPDKPPTPRVPDKKEFPVVPTAPVPVVQQVPQVRPPRSLAEELAAAQAATNRQTRVTSTPPTHELSHRR
ncbi:MobA/MobL family protein [Fannyhessea vaginae]|uniref:MobA/MobL family protein n=1 Tax=Fannyhessea vaginae TaxID=82135 RepID=UPI001F2A5A00|nr:MobA/MobL family protein [Fannyhessea vaginae]